MTGIARAAALAWTLAAWGAAVAQEAGARPAPRAPAGQAAAPGAPVTAEERSGLWRSARWGMTVEELLAAFPGEARRLDPEIRLADGDVVAAELGQQQVAGHPMVARFVFSGGRLALVSLRTPPDARAGDGVYGELQAHLEARLGAPTYAVVEKPFVEQRQTRWALARGVVDLKAIPGTVVLMYSAPPPAAGAAR